MGVVIALVGVVLTLIGVLVAMYHGFLGTRISKKLEKQSREDHDWQLKHESVAVQLVKITPQVAVPEPGHNSFVMLYPMIFPEAKFREAIETYIVELDSKRSTFMPRSPRPDELRSPRLRETVEKAAAILDAFRKANPDIAARYVHD